MRRRANFVRTASMAVLVLVMLAGSGATGVGLDPVSAATREPSIDPGLRAEAHARGTVPVIVEMAPSATRQTDAVRSALPVNSVQAAQALDDLPLIALVVTPDGLDALGRDPRVGRVWRNQQRKAVSSFSVTSIGAPTAWASGATGSGQTVAVVDTGVDSAHPFLAGKVVAEACFSSTMTNTTAACPGADPTTATGAGAAAPCPAMPDCNHGTHVAGVVAGGSGGTLSGVAPGATIVAVQVFSTLSEPADCAPDPAPCATSWSSDVIRGLNYVHSLRSTYSIAAVNLSLGGGQYSAPCDDEPEAVGIDQLRADGIVSVVAAGNYGNTVNGKSTIAAPACVSSAVAVGATDDLTDTVPGWSSSSPQLAVLAPGSSILSSVSVAQSSPFPSSGPCPAPFGSGLCASESGTSMATPHVAGAMAVIRSAHPTMTGDDLVTLVRNTGVPITDAGNDQVTPRLQLDAAVRPPTFHPLAPVRVLDTRDGTGEVIGPVGAASTITTTVVGRGGVPPSGVSAVVLNVTAASPSAASFVTVFPSGSPRPLASNLNVDAATNRANLVVAKLGPAGQVSLYNNSGSVQLIADVAGWFDTGGANDSGDHYQPVNPTRVLDTRTGAGLPGGVPARVGTGASITFDPTAACGFAGPSAVVLNLTAAAPTAASHVTAWPAGTARPEVSNVNFYAGHDTPGLVMIKTGTGGAVSLFNNSGEVDLVADLAGCYRTDAGPTGRVVTMVPTRVLDTRVGIGGVTGPIGTTPIELSLTGHHGIPHTGVSAVVLNLTVTETTSPSHLTVWPAGDPMPTASNLNFVTGQTVANLVVVRVGITGGVSIINNSGTTQVVADVTGWVTG